MSTERKKIYLKDYQPHPFVMDQVHLDFDLYEDHVMVSAITQVKRNPKSSVTSKTLFLNGEGLELISVSLDKKPITSYRLTPEGLEIDHCPDSFELEIVTKIEPQKNKSFEGLYKSNGMFCTQCEAQGFRHITYFIDRPDNMAIFTTKINADQKSYPFLLSNGNLVKTEILGNGRHSATWKDPFKKPSYLFALVAGDLEKNEDTFQTMSGRQVKLQIYVNKGRSSRVAFAMEALKRSMIWDEQRYGLEYDLDLFMIVAVDDFNMGAMENKGLNIFNSSLLVADPHTAKDDTYLAIESVVGHEYFHNWTGNRVTCRDWFQLSLKEGLTVYRDQEFSSDMFSRPVQRISDVAALRMAQFTEDAGPNAHPVRPDSCYSIDNFYTSTIYQKGAEVIRMIEAIVGVTGFRKGMDKYFELFDGQAVTTDDFVHAMEIPNEVDLSQFKLWYTQDGTPRVSVSQEYNPATETLLLRFNQVTPPTPRQKDKKPFHIPIKVGLISANGTNENINMAGTTPSKTITLNLKNQNDTFILQSVKPNSVVSLLRDFSAPVILDSKYSDKELVHLMKYDENLFNKWDAAQKLYTANIQAHYKTGRKLSPELVDAFGENLKKVESDPLFYALLIKAPSFQEAMTGLKAIDPDRFGLSIDYLEKELATTYFKEVLNIYKTCKDREPRTFTVTPAAVGNRALKGRTLKLISLVDQSLCEQLAEELYQSATNFTDKLNALSAINDIRSAKQSILRETALKEWSQDPIVFNEYLRLVSSSQHPKVFEEIQQTMLHPKFSLQTPNNVYGLIRNFMIWNPRNFHKLDGSTYHFAANLIKEIDGFNPAVAASLAKGFEISKYLAPEYRPLIVSALETLLNEKKLNAKSFELLQNTYTELR